MEEKLNELSIVNALIFGLLFAASYYVFFYHASNPETVIPGLDQNIATLKNEVLEMDREIEKGKTLKQEIEDLGAKADKVYKYIPEELSLDQASSSVSEEARLAGLSIKSIRTAPTWSDRETISVGTVDVSVQGEFNQIMIFLSELTRKEIVYSIKKIQIQDRYISQGGLDLNAQINFFKRRENLEKGG